MRWNDRAAKRKGRHGTDTTGQESRQHAEPTDRQPPAAIHIMGGERNDPRQASTWRRDRRQEIRMRNESTPQSHRNRRRPAHRVARRGETQEPNRPDGRDDKRGERRDEPTGKQDIATRPTRRDENITTPHRSRADKASRPKEYCRGNGMSRLSTLEQTAGQNQSSRAPTLPASRPANRVEERGDGRAR